MRITVRSVVMVASILLAGSRLPSRAAPGPVKPKIVRVSRTTRPSTRPAGKTAKPKPTTRARAAKVNSLAGAKALSRTGDYAAAEAAYRKLVSIQSMRIAASLGLADALAMTGKYDKALAALAAVSAEAAANAGWHLARAETLAAVGRYTEALASAATANKVRPKWAPTIRARGNLLERLGRKKEAIDVYKTMEHVVAGREYLRDARSLVALGNILDRYAVLIGMKASQQAGNIYNNYFRKAYLEVDKTYWPAYVAAGMFQLAKHRPRSAAQEFKLAAKVNKRIPELLCGLGVIQLSSWRFERCLAQVKAALAINPNYPPAHLLKATCLMQWRKFDQVEPVLKKLLAINPNHLEGLSLMAALHVRLRQPDQAAPYIQRVGKINPTYAGLPNAIGQWLAAGRQFDQAEKYYRDAIRLEPGLADGYANLGRMYMQTGDEDKARRTLDKAHKIDDFRADVVNYLQLLRRMDRYAVKETDHFIVKVDGKHDRVLLDQVAEYMESIYEPVCGDYEYEPSVKTIIEIFPTHSAFSVRISGKGWIGTIGACTGRVIALVAPNRRRSQFGNHNWANVLRHEFTHAVTLSATGNRIPHWFTEACATWQQPDKRNYRYVQMLVAATRAGKLFSVKQLDWGFIRPKRRGDRSLAYAQAQWTQEFLIATKGYKTIPAMLRGFRDGMSQAEVFDKIVGASEKDFDKAFIAWAKKTIREWGFDPAPLPDYTKAAKAAKDKPKDAAAQADWAVALYLRRRRPQALAAARKALKLDANNRRALSVAARVLAATKKYDQAIEMARRLDAADPTSQSAPRVLAKCYLAKRDTAKALAALELLKQRQPLDSYSYTQLAKLYTQLGRPDDALGNLIHLHRHTMNDPKYAQQIAEIYRAREDYDNALVYFRQILYINPYEAGAYKAVAAIQVRAKRYPKAIEAAEYWCLLQPDSAEPWTTMALVRYRAGKATRDKAQLSQARTAIQKALEIAPSPRAKQVLAAIDRALKG